MGGGYPGDPAVADVLQDARRTTEAEGAPCQGRPPEDQGGSTRLATDHQVGELNHDEGNNYVYCDPPCPEGQPGIG